MSGIVVGIDGSQNARHALDWAMAEAAAHNADLTVITVHPVAASYWSGQPVDYPGDDQQVEHIRKSAQDAVNKASDSLGDRQPKSVKVVAVNGLPTKTLMDASESADLLVVGSRGGGGFSSLFLGSVSNQLVHHAKCPVVVVRTGR